MLLDFLFICFLFEVWLVIVRKTIYIFQGKLALSITTEQGKTLKGAHVDILHGLGQHLSMYSFLDYHFPPYCFFISLLKNFKIKLKNWSSYGQGNVSFSF